MEKLFKAAEVFKHKNKLSWIPLEDKAASLKYGSKPFYIKHLIASPQNVY